MTHPRSPSEARAELGLEPGHSATTVLGAALLRVLHLPGPRLGRPWGPDLFPTTLVACFSLPAACYLFNSDREKEGSPVLRDHAHFLAYSPTVCPCHPEIQNHDCLKRGKCDLVPCLPLAAPGRCLFLLLHVSRVETMHFLGNQRMAITWVWLLPWGFPFPPCSLCSRIFFPPSPICLCLCQGQEQQADAHHSLSLCQW